MKIFLTGSSGFIGRNLKESWQEKYNLYAPGHQELDLLNQKQVELYLEKHKFDLVIHAANTNDVTNTVSSYEILDRNLRMFCNLQRCSELYGKMYFFGSGMEYDVQHYIPRMKETYFGTYVPHDPYGFSKYLMTQLLSKTSNIYNLRLFGVFGQYEEWQRRFISNQICRSIKGKHMLIYQNSYFDYLYINDLINILEWFLHNTPKDKQYNVCSGHPVTLLSLAKLIAEITGYNKKIVIQQSNLNKEYSGNPDRLIQELGSICFTPFSIAIKELVEYYIQNEDLIDVKKLD